MSTPKSPECEKMYKVAGDSQTIGAFLDWLQNEKELVIAEWVKSSNQYDDSLVPTQFNIEAVLAEYYEIDLEVVEQECRANLKYCRRRDAIAWVEEYATREEDVELDDVELEQAFEAIFERPADDQDRDEGLWSHLCAARAVKGDAS